MVELLAPAGTMEALQAAIASGANAIYLSGTKFGARAYAHNFAEDELRIAVEYAHLRNVDIHVTINTLLKDTELSELKSYIHFLRTLNIDAILVQDLGVGQLVRELAPEIPLHASTQMSVNNLAGVLQLAQLGYRRVVLAREVSLADITYICNNSPIEIEVFAHGAICVAYSGQCLMSSMIGGRSGNRGRCAQPCRLEYDLIDAQGRKLLSNAGKYLLSPRDMNTLELVPELLTAGVTSLKLEGRMKSPEYVYSIVDAYRQVIDAFYDNHELQRDVQAQVRKIFNREFTTAYLQGKQGKNMISDYKPNNRGLRMGKVHKINPQGKQFSIKLTDTLVRGDIIQINQQQQATIKIEDIYYKHKVVSSAVPGTIVDIDYTSQVHVKPGDIVYKVYDEGFTSKVREEIAIFQECKPHLVDIVVHAKLGEPFSLSGKDELGHEHTINSDFIVEIARKTPLSELKIINQVNRLGNTAFRLNEILFEIDDNIMVPVSVINETRRQLIEALTQDILTSYKKVSTNDSSSTNTTQTQANIKLEESLLVDANLNMELDAQAKSVPKFNKKLNDENKTKLVVQVNLLADIQIAIDNGADIILVGGDSYNHQPITVNDYCEAITLIQDAGRQVAISSPRILRAGEENWYRSLIRKLNDFQPDYLYVHSLGEYNLATEVSKLPLIADYSFNITNQESLQFLRRHGFAGACLSQELTLKEIEALQAQNCLEFPLEVIVHGYTELMVSEYCPIGSFLGDLDTGICSAPCVNNAYFLSDRKQIQFPVVTDQFCHMHLLNSVPLNFLRHVTKLQRMQVSKIRIDGRYLNSQELGKTVQLYRQVLDKGDIQMVIDDATLRDFEDNITRGHYFRGIE